MVTTYGFPKHDLTAAIAAADDLARRYGDGSARRFHPDGSIELAAMEGWFRRRFLLYRVSSDGTPTLEESTDAPGAYKLSVAMIVVGGALFAATVIVAILRGDELGASSVSPWSASSSRSSVPSAPIGSA